MEEKKKEKTIIIIIKNQPTKQNPPTLPFSEGQTVQALISGLISDSLIFLQAPPGKVIELKINK